MTATMRSLFLRGLALAALASGCPAMAPAQSPGHSAVISHRVDSVLRLMTLEEKVGQMNQYNGDWDATGLLQKTGTNKTR